LFTLPHPPKTLRIGTAWDSGLSMNDKRTVILFLALHGGADNAGPFFVYEDGDLNEKNFLRLDEVLGKIEKLKTNKVVLILDATQVVSRWPLGMLRNEFAHKLQELNDRIEKIPNLVVLSASGPDQRSWPA